MEQHFSILKNTRDNVLGLIEGLDTAALNVIPAGFNNNLAWNLGHILVTQQLLCYRLAGEDCYISDPIIDAYRKGSKPNGPIDEALINTFKGQLLSLQEKIRTDYSQGRFKSYKPYQTSYGANLNSVTEAIIFNNVHEGMHLGTMMAMKKLI